MTDEAKCLGKDGAFPCNSVYHEIEWGMSKREYFAAMALAGLLAKQEIKCNLDIEDIAIEAVGIADELLEKLAAEEE
jgi:hypothetical protein